MRRLEVGPPSEPEQDAVSATMRLQGQAQVVFPDAWARVTALPGRMRRQSPCLRCSPG